MGQPTIRVYHLTSNDAAERIRREGFDDDEASFVDGIYVSDPMYDLGSLPPAKRERLLAIDIDPRVLAPYGGPVEGPDGLPDDRYQEWVVPAAILNRWPVTDHGAPE